jgi:hypothetical protein
MILSNCTIPHSGHGYVLEITEDPGELTSMSSELTALGGLIVGVGAGNGCAWVIVIALRVSVLKKSLALRPGSAAFFTGLDRNQLLQLKEPDRQNTSKRSEIFRSFFILYLLIVSFSKTKQDDRPMDFQSSPLLFPFIRYNFREFQMLYRYIY